MKKVDLITGFLGSGKTTFLLKYARYLMNKGLKIGILEYDFGAVNVDMINLGVLRGDKCELEMIDSSGDAESTRRRLQTKLIAMSMSGYDRVIIEPSGVFDMDMFFDLLRDEPLESRYEIGNVISIINSKNAEEDEVSDYFMASQAMCAGSVLLSRTQFATDDEISRTKNHLTEVADKIGCRDFKSVFYEKSWDELTEEDFERISNSGYYVNDYRKVVFNGSSDFSAISILKYSGNLEQLKQLTEILFADKKYGRILRVKGFLIEEGQNFRINVTPSEFTKEKAIGGQSILIVIGTDLNDTAVKDLFDVK